MTRFDSFRFSQRFAFWRSVAPALCCFLALCCGVAVGQQPSAPSRADSDAVDAAEKSGQRERMRKLLAVDSRGVQTRYPSVAKIVGRAESRIDDDACPTIPLYYGTGEYVAEYGAWGIVITNWHVVCESDKAIDVCFPSKSYPARTILRDEKWDLAALIIPRPEKLRPIPITLNVPYFNDRLWVGGYGPTEGLDGFELHEGRLRTYVSLDLPKETVFKDGEIVREDGALYETEMIDVGVRSGDSGGPVFNEYGELAGCLWGSDKKSSMGTNGARVFIFVMEAIQEAAKLRAQKLADAETTFENPDMPLTPGVAPNACARANSRLSASAEEDAFASIRSMTRGVLSGARELTLSEDRRDDDVCFYPISHEPLYVSGNGVDTPESLRRLGAVKRDHVIDVAEQYWKRNAGGLPPSPPIYSPGYLGMQALYGEALPELVKSDSFATLDAKARDLVAESRRPSAPALGSPLEEEEEEKSAPQFVEAASSRPWVGASEPDVQTVPVAQTPRPVSREAHISQFQAYAIFCVILVLLCVSGILLRNVEAEPLRR